jgi:hypothetical protein
MSRTKVMTLQELNKQKETKLSQEEYISHLERMNELNEIIERQADENDILTEEKSLLLKEYKDLRALVKKYKQQSEENVSKEKAQEDYNKELERNKIEAEEIARKRKPNKYSKLTKEQSAKIALDKHLQLLKSLE